MSAVIDGHNSLMHKWARWYVEKHGLSVFPIPSGSKKPGALGINSATTNLQQVDEWWSAEPNFNIGVTGCLRIDIDVKNGGLDAWNKLAEEHGDIRTLTARTPSGGLHVYLRSAQELGNSTGELPIGIDVRGHATGYTVAPPSVTHAVPGESSAGRYEFIDAQAEIMQAPPWLLDRIRAKNTQEAVAPSRTQIDADTLTDVRDALLSPAMLKDWARWSDNGLALLSLGDTGYKLWLEYSVRQVEACPDHTPGPDDAETWWARHSRTNPKSDYRSIFSRAQALGWKNPKAVDTTQLGFGERVLPAVVPPESMTASTTGPIPARRFQPVSAWDWASGPPPRWLIDGLLPESGIGLLYGVSGSGKSFFAFHAAASVARGVPYGSPARKVQQGRVVYVAAEGVGGMRARVRAYQQQNSLEELPPLDIVRAPPNMMRPGDVEELSAEIGQAALTIIDTVHVTMAGGDENSAKDMGAFLAGCRAIQRSTGGLVLLIHHAGKDESRGARGSSSLRAAVDVEIEITRNGDKRTARITKQRDGEDGTEWSFHLVQVPLFDGQSSSAVVVSDDFVTEMQQTARKSARTRISPEQQEAVEIAFELIQFHPEGVTREVLVQSIIKRRPDRERRSVVKTITRCVDQNRLFLDENDVIRIWP